METTERDHNHKILPSVYTIFSVLKEYCVYSFLFLSPVSITLGEIFTISLIILAIIGRLVNIIIEKTRKGNISFRGIIQIIKPVNTFINIPIYVFLMVSLISSLQGLDPGMSIMAFLNKTVKYILLYFVIAETIDTQKKIRRSLIAIFSMLFVMSCDAFFQYITGYDLIRHFPQIRAGVTASFKHPNSFGAYLILVIPLVISLLLYMRRKIVILSLFILSSFSLILTFSRGAVVGFAGSLLLIGSYIKKAVLVILILVCISFIPLVPNKIIERAGTIQEGSYRLPLWREACTIIRDYPIFGIGFGLYSEIAPRYKTVEWGGVYPHNSYLHIAAEMGIAGLLSFLWILFGIFKVPITSLNKRGKIFSSQEVSFKKEELFYKHIILGLISGLFAFSIHSFFDVNFLSPRLIVMFWAFVAFLVSTLKCSER